MFKVLIFAICFTFSFGFRCYTCFDEKKSNATLQELKNHGYILPQNQTLCEDGYGEKIECPGHCVKKVKDSGEVYGRFCHKDILYILSLCGVEDGIKTCKCTKDLCNRTSCHKSGVMSVLIVWLGAHFFITYSSKINTLEFT